MCLNVVVSKCCICSTESVMGCRGDRIRCTLLFKKAIVVGGKLKIPVSFSLNGRKIITEEGREQFFMDFSEPLYPYVAMLHGGSALAKVRTRGEGSKKLLLLRTMAVRNSGAGQLRLCNGKRRVFRKKEKNRAVLLNGSYRWQNGSL